MEHSTISNRGQTTIPAEIRQRLGLKPGDRLFYDERDGDIILRAHSGLDAVAGLLRSKIKRPLASFEVERQAATEAWAREGIRGPEPLNS